MRNITIALDDETHRKARIRAAELGTSLSALVKQYLVGLVDGDAPPPSGVREMKALFNAPPQQGGGPPWFIDGEWVYTPDGKPRQPGSMRGMWIAEDFDRTPDWLIDAMEGEDSQETWPE